MAFLISILMAVVLVPALAMGFDGWGIIKGRNTMVTELKRPLLDDSVPAVTETATFALG